MTVGELEYDYVIDIKGLCCSAPVIRLTNEMKTLKSGNTVLVISDKCSMLSDIPAFCNMMKHELLRQEATDDLYRFWIKKR